MLTLAAIGVAGWGIYALAHTWARDPKKITGGAQTIPMKDPKLIPDPAGVLDEAWLKRTLAIPAGTAVQQLDLYALKKRLLADGQVLNVVLKRNFPDVLEVTLGERSPVARVRVQENEGLPNDFLVDRYGVVYSGKGYDQTRIESLPFLDGIKLRKSGKGGYEPIEGMDDVATLLVEAQGRARHLYEDWRVISLARLADYDEIIVHGQEIAEAVFNRRENPVPQLARLDSVLDFAHAQQTVVARVDLSIGTQVPVQPPAKPSLVPSNFSSNQRKTKRDL